MKYIIVLFTFLSSVFAFAEDITFSNDELARETVFPVFRSTEMIKNRYVKTKGRFEIGFGAGINQTDPLYEGINYNGAITYNLTEIHGVRLTGMLIQKGLSANGKKIKEGVKGRKIDFSKVPHPSQMIIADYQFTALYGKISLTKNTVLNLSLYGLVGGGFINFTPSASDLNISDISASPVFSTGFGFKAYLNPHIALQYDLKLPIYRGANPLHKDVTSGKDDGSYSGNSWKTDIYFPIISNFSLVFLF